MLSNSYADEKHRGRMKDGTYFALFALEFIKNLQSLKLELVSQVEEEVLSKSMSFVKQVQSKVPIYLDIRNN